MAEALGEEKVRQILRDYERRRCCPITNKRAKSKISKGAWPLSLLTTTSTGNKLWRCSRSAQLHVDTPDTPNWYIKHHQGLEYLNMAMAQVTDNPAMAEGSSIHQEAKQ